MSRSRYFVGLDNKPGFTGAAAAIRNCELPVDRSTTTEPTTYAQVRSTGSR
ncbi:hypothetical protein ACQHIV_00870 [Kribbella sp. GL6]|uniref:hypothetical protein n=1 Tax=Kribbella sp. GL6 TaxID=3419765 RepID=UPI003D05F628